MVENNYCTQHPLKGPSLVLLIPPITHNLFFCRQIADIILELLRVPIGSQDCFLSSYFSITFMLCSQFFQPILILKDENLFVFFSKWALKNIFFRQKNVQKGKFFFRFFRLNFKVELNNIFYGNFDFTVLKKENNNNLKIFGLLFGDLYVHN